MNTEKKTPDYADMVALENFARNNQLIAYTERYEQLAFRYGEDAVYEALQQLNGGQSW